MVKLVHKRKYLLGLIYNLKCKQVHTPKHNNFFCIITIKNLVVQIVKFAPTYFFKIILILNEYR